MRRLESSRAHDDGVVFDIFQAYLFKVGKRLFISEENSIIQESCS